ncbi:MAG: hypothetical protein CM15mP120_10660 [Pseudomonadota bacterium]|nr:MAG: hypothetical protein CM15mP120_10660 [Pseudomonadota bacterium]
MGFRRRNSANAAEELKYQPPLPGVFDVSDLSARESKKYSCNCCQGRNFRPDVERSGYQGATPFFGVEAQRIQRGQDEFA